MDVKGPIEIEVACATPERQRVVRLTVQAPCTAREAVEASGLLDEFPGLAVAPGRIGVFGEVVDPDHLLEADDRVEIYRPLARDPKEARRARAAAQRAARAGRARRGR